jgi:hypothetical protein
VGNNVNQRRGHSHDICRNCGLCHGCDPFIVLTCKVTATQDERERQQGQSATRKKESQPSIPHLGQNGTRPVVTRAWTNWYTKHPEKLNGVAESTFVKVDPDEAKRINAIRERQAKRRKRSF